MDPIGGLPGSIVVYVACGQFLIGLAAQAALFWIARRALARRGLGAVPRESL